MSNEWKGALRLQIEALAKRNDLHRRCTRESIQKRTKEMDQKIIKMRELLSTDINQAAHYYLECLCYTDETDAIMRIINRTSSRDKGKNKRGNGDLRYISSFENATSSRSVASSSAVEVVSPEALPHAMQQRKWWNIHRKEEYYGNRKHEVRQLWSSQNDFLSHSIALVVGVGNIFRFPAAIYRSGGTFLIPYLLMQLIVGFPIVYLQLSIGQFAALGPASALGRLAPVSLGLGWVLVLMAVPFILYYNVFAAWSLFYLTEMLFSTEIPWQRCDKGWNSSRVCCSLDNLELCQSANSTVLSTETFMHSSIIHVTGAAMGSLQPHIVAGLAVAWLLTVAIYFRPSPTTHFTASFPFFILTLLALCGSSLPGAKLGLTHLFGVKSKNLYSYDVWLFALEQIFFELALCGGPLISLAALNRFRTNIFRDSAVLVSSSVICSLLSAIVVFCFAGNLMIVSNLDIRRLVAYDFRYFTFIVLPSMTYTIQGGSFWFTLFLIALTFSIIDAQHSWIRLITSTILNKLRSKNQILDTRLFIAISVGAFICALPLCTFGGVYLFHSIDCLISNWTVSLTLFFLIILISHVYGIGNYLRDISCMLRIPLHSRWSASTSAERLQLFFGPTGVLIKYCWSIIIPIILLSSTLLFLVTRERIKFARNPVPWPYELVAWILVSAPLLTIPTIFFYQLAKVRRTGKVFLSLFDGSKWSQLEASQLEAEPELEEQPRVHRRGRPAMRENTYMYIDPLSRGNTERSITAITIEDNYGWRMGRLKEVQEDPSLRQSESQNSFDASITSQGTTKGEITLFGSPPASNAQFTMAEAISARAAMNRRQRAFSTAESLPSPPDIQLNDVFTKCFSISEPPVIPGTPPPRSSPAAKSEPPRAMTDRPSSSLRSKSEYSDSDEDNGINPQRITVIRRFCSEDSVGLQSNTSISITPCDRLTEVDRQRSMSSLAIYDPQSENRPRQTLSQLKRPEPINAPNKSPTRF